MSAQFGRVFDPLYRLQSEGQMEFRSSAGSDSSSSPFVGIPEALGRIIKCFQFASLSSTVVCNRAVADREGVRHPHALFS